LLPPLREASDEAIYRRGHVQPMGRLRSPNGPLQYHYTKANRAYRQQVGFPRKWWPAQSPDLNPIENVWSIIKRRINRKRHRIHSKEEMIEAILKEWASLTTADYLKCIDSMEKRVKICILAEGGPIKY
jgi:DDE superfamily endonuclease